MFVSKTSSGLTKLIHQNLSRIPERKSPPKNNIPTSSKPELRRRYPVYFQYFSPKWTGLRVLKATGLRNRVHLRRLRGCSRDGAVFSGESLFEGQKSPWELTLTEPVPEIFELVPLICQKNISGSPRMK